MDSGKVGRSKVRKRVCVGTLIPPLFLMHLSTWETPSPWRFSRISASSIPSRSGHQITPLLEFMVRCAETLSFKEMNSVPSLISNILETRSDGLSTKKQCPVFLTLPQSIVETPLNHLFTAKMLHLVSGLSGVMLSTTRYLGVTFGGWCCVPASPSLGNSSSGQALSAKRPSGDFSPASILDLFLRLGPLCSGLSRLSFNETPSGSGQLAQSETWL